MRQRADRNPVRRPSRRCDARCRASRRRTPRGSPRRRTTRTHSAITSSGMLSSSTMSAPAAIARSTCSSRSHSTSIFTPLRRQLARALHRLADVAVERGEVVVLDQHAGRQIHPMVRAAARAHRVLLERAPAGRASFACRGSWRPVPRHRVDVARGERRDAGQVLHDSSARRARPRAARARGR